MGDERVRCEEATEMVERHLVACCAELMERDRTGILPDGKVREVARICSYAGSHALALAESMVTHEAVRRIASWGTKTVVEIDGSRCRVELSVDTDELHPGLYFNYIGDAPRS